MARRPLETLTTLMPCAGNVSSTTRCVVTSWSATRSVGAMTDGPQACSTRDCVFPLMKSTIRCIGVPGEKHAS